MQSALCNAVAMHYLLRRIKRVKMILPALTEAKSPFFRPIKYSLFPPLGLDLPRRRHEGALAQSAAARGLRRRLEEARADVGHRDPGETRHEHAASPGGSAERLRTVPALGRIKGVDDGDETADADQDRTPDCGRSPTPSPSPVREGGE